MDNITLYDRSNSLEIYWPVNDKPNTLWWVGFRQCRHFCNDVVSRTECCRCRGGLSLCKICKERR